MKNKRSEYLFGFNGMEKDNELKGIGNSLDFGARMYDSRLGRWLSLDPLAAEYPSMSPYNFVANSPLMFIDPDGNKIVAYDKASVDLVLGTMKYLFGKDHGFSFNTNGVLTHNGKESKMSSQQRLMFKYVNDVLVNSNTENKVRANETRFSTLKFGNDNKFYLVEDKIDNGGMTYPVNALVQPEGQLAGFIYSAFRNETIISPNVMKNGINMYTKSGLKNFSKEHALAHEFGHQIVETILHEFGGEYNGVNFNNMTQQEQLDWAIRFTNTLNSEKNNLLETGEQQEGREKGEVPPESNIAPLEE